MNRNISGISDRPPDKKKNVGQGANVLDYSSSLTTPSWQIERNLADKIMNHVTKHKLNFKVDQLTRGRGNCFMIAVLQQLKQDHVYRVSSDQIKKLADEFCHQRFRQAIRNFAINSNDRRISDIKESYNVAKSARLHSESWNQYWQSMLKEGKWADAYFVQATAAFLNMDLMIVDTACNEKNPFYTIKAQEDSTPLVTLSIGLVTNVHYQSLVRDQIQNDSEVDQTSISSTSCPCCNKRLKNVLLHIKKSEKCKQKISDSVIRDLESKSLSIKKMKQKNRNIKHCSKIKEMIKKNEFDDTLLMVDTWLGDPQVLADGVNV